jgi:hypothetical protein
MAATGVTVGPDGVGDVPGDAFTVPIALAYDGGVAAAGAGAGTTLAALCGGGVLGIGGAGAGTGTGTGAETSGIGGAAPNAAPMDIPPSRPLDAYGALSNPPNPPPKPRPTPRFSPKPIPGPSPVLKPPSPPPTLIPVSAICGFGNGCASSLS